MNKKETINQIKTDMKSLDYCCHQIIRINQELEVINHQKTGLARHQPRLTKEQEQSSKPMPTYQHSYSSPLALFELSSQLERDKHYWQQRICECTITELLDIRDQNILWELYIFGKRQWDVAIKYGYSRTGLIRHIDTILWDLVKNS